MANLRLLTLNDVKIVGRLTRDPEVRFTTQGTPVARLRIAVGRKYKDRNSGEWKEEVAFVPATVWRETAERCGQRLKKGSPIYIEGRLKSKEWQTKEGQKRSDLEIEVGKVQFLESSGDFAGAGSDAASSAAPSAGVSQPAEPVASGASGPQSDDEVPF